MTDYDAILFDNDGVLVEPPADATLRRAAKSAFRAVGVEDPDERHVSDVLRGVTPESLREVCGVYGLDPEEFWTARDRHASEAQREEFRDGDRARYDHRNRETGPRFDTYYGRQMGVESLEKKKPDPHFLELALADLGAETALFVGDSESDVEAARRAGLDSAFLRREHCADVSLSVEPTYEIESLREIAEVVS